MRTTRAVILLAAIVSTGALLAPAPASASLFCPLKKTSDGFVALRAGPSPAARLVARMRPSDEVGLGEARQGKWVEVTWWRGDDRLGKPHNPPAGHGWAHRALIGDCG